MAENKTSKVNLHIAYDRNSKLRKNTVRKVFTESELKTLAKKNYFDVYPTCNEVFASGYGQFFFSEGALTNATKEESDQFLRLGIKRS